MLVDGAAMRFSYEGLVVEAHCSDRSHLDWLEEFVSPHFELENDRAPHCRVSLIFDTARFDELARKGPSGEKAAAFVLDNSVIALPIWNAEEAKQVVFDGKFEVFYLVDDQRVTLLARKNRLSVRTPFMRVVREFAMNHAQNAGAFFLHASSFAVGERAVIIAGPKNMGKTTLLMYALHDPSTRYLTNDRLLVSSGEGGFRLRGMPTILSVREGTFELLLGLRPALFKRRFHFRSTLMEAAEAKSPPARAWADGRMGLTAAQACALLGKQLVSEARPVSLLFPRITHREGSIDFLEISGQSVADRLFDCVFGAKHRNVVSDVFNPPDRSPGCSRSDLHRLCGELTAAVDCFECHLGQHAYVEASSPPEFVGRALNGKVAKREGRSNAAL